MFPWGAMLWDHKTHSSGGTREQLPLGMKHVQHVTAAIPWVHWSAPGKGGRLLMLRVWLLLRAPVDYSPYPDQARPTIHPQSRQYPKIRTWKNGIQFFFHQRHILWTSFDIFIVTYRVTNFLPKLVDMLLFSTEKTEFPFFEFPIFGFCPLSPIILSAKPERFLCEYTPHKQNSK